MDFDVHKRSNGNKKNFSSSNIDIGYKFAKEISKELKDLVKSIVIFGSAARKMQDTNDIDILLIVDDVAINFGQELAQTYRIIVQQTVAKVSTKIHVTSMKFTSFWEYVRQGDPIAINILRDGYALLDTGFFDPLQLLLYQGRIRPSSEALWAYYNRAPRTLLTSKARILDACVDLYWAVIDSAHAALMSVDAIPPSPEHVAEYLESHLAKKGLIDKNLPFTMRKFYKLSKEISTRSVHEVSGAQFDKYLKEASDFVDAMRSFIDK